MNLTILTPTYNRRGILQLLYESLEKQENKEFIWLIVDDGSTDDTETYVNCIKSKASFPVEFERKKNGGKHTALNYAYQFIKTKLTFIVDSDDSLTFDAVSTILDVYEKYKNETDLCGFSFMRGKSDGGLQSSSDVPKDGMKENFIECRLKRDISGDMAEVWFTHCLKEYPFPVYEGERFLGEDIVWIKMAEKYKLRFFNKIIYMADYRDDGLTNNRRKNNINSPKGCVARAEVFLQADVGIKFLIKAMLQYQIYGRFAQYSMIDLMKKTDRKILFTVCFLPALVLYVQWKGKAYKDG